MALVHEELTRLIIGASMEVHRTLGSGFLEAVYQEALELELRLRAIPFMAQQEISIAYKDQTLKQKCKPDFLVDHKVIVEIKVSSQLTEIDEAQVDQLPPRHRVQGGLTDQLRRQVSRVEAVRSLIRVIRVIRG